MHVSHIGKRSVSSFVLKSERVSKLLVCIIANLCGMVLRTGIGITGLGDIQVCSQKRNSPVRDLCRNGIARCRSVTYKHALAYSGLICFDRVSIGGISRSLQPNISDKRPLLVQDKIMAGICFAAIDSYSFNSGEVIGDFRGS